MATFTYRAMDKVGKEIAGKISASGEAVVVQRLREMGYFPTEVRKVGSESVGVVRLNDLPVIRPLYRLVSGGRVKLTTLANFTRELATLLGAGLPLLRSLEILGRNEESSNLQNALTAVTEAVEDGATFSEALASRPQVFNRLFVSMVKAGEIGGSLEEILERLATYYEKSAALRGKILSALYYPITVLIIATLLVTLILIFIVPRLQAVYDDLGSKLPTLTLALLHASYVLRTHAPWVITGVVLLCLLIQQIGKTHWGRMLFDEIKLRIPLFGVLVRKAVVARFARTLATLLDAGVPIVHALAIVKDTAGNDAVARATVEIHTSIREGEAFAEPMKRCPVFPDLVVQMVAVGEESGTLDQMLTKVAQAYERQVDQAVEGLTALIEPILIVMLGVLIGFIVIALYMPLIKPPLL